MNTRVRESRRAIRKVVSRRNLADSSEVLQNLAYWLSRSPEERIAAVEHLRRMHIGASARLQRTARVIQRPPGWVRRSRGLCLGVPRGSTVHRRSDSGPPLLDSPSVPAIL